MELILKITGQGCYDYWGHRTGVLGDQILDILYKAGEAGVSVQYIVDTVEKNPWSHETILYTLLELMAKKLLKPNWLTNE